MTGKNYGIFGFGKKRVGGVDSTPFLASSNVTQFLVVVVVGIVLVSILAGIVGIWFESAAEVQKQVTMGVLLFIILIAALIPFTLVRRQFTGFTTKDFVFIVLAISVLIFLLVITPKIFNLPDIFTFARLELVQTTQAVLGNP